MTNPNYDRPAGYFGQVVLNPVRQYYLDSYTNIRASSQNTLEMIHDAFQSLSSWNGWERPPDFQGVALDTHIYQILSNAVSPLIVCPRVASEYNYLLLGRSANGLGTHSHRVWPGQQPPGIQ
jgi:glucan 1,3-beta-glucosidase